MVVLVFEMISMLAVAFFIIGLPVAIAHGLASGTLDVIRSVKCSRQEHRRQQELEEIRARDKANSVDSLARLARRTPAAIPPEGWLHRYD